jgi:sulfur-oxidizing protein SoxZ
MTTPTPRARVPASARPGEIVTLRALLTHPMESGFRRDADGALVPRKIARRFECSFEGRPVFTVDLEPFVSANPFFEFRARVERSGSFRFVWTDDDGAVYTLEQAIEVA